MNHRVHEKKLTVWFAAGRRNTQGPVGQQQQRRRKTGLEGKLVAPKPAILVWDSRLQAEQRWCFFVDSTLCDSFQVEKL